jgi:hypothetical protein
MIEEEIKELLFDITEVKYTGDINTRCLVAIVKLLADIDLELKSGRTDKAILAEETA